MTTFDVLVKGKSPSKARVMAAFAHEIPDRVPVNYFGNAGINSRLAEHYGLAPGDHERLMQALGVDFRTVWPPYTGPRLHTALPDVNVDPAWGFVTRWIEHSSGGYWDYCDFPLADADEEAVADYPMPSPDHFDYSGAADLCSSYREFAIGAGSPGLGNIINGSGTFRGMEQTLVDLATDDPAGLLLVDRRLDVELEKTGRLIEACRGKIDFLWIGEDVGTQRGPFVSMQMFRKHIRPRLQRFADLASSYGLPSMIHSCGSSSWAFDDFVEMGISAVDTLQPEAPDMSPQHLKSLYGDRLMFHGCISTAGPFANGSVADVVKNVRETLETMKPGGGFCMAPTHDVQDNTPVENVLAMYKTAREFGAYR